MSGRITPSKPCFMGLKLVGETVFNCLYWIFVPAGLLGFIIMEMVGYAFCHVLLAEVNRCLLLDSLSLPAPYFWKASGLGEWDEFLSCLVALVIAMLSEPRILADGFILSSHRRIQLPRFRPASISLSCTLRWTISAISNAARVRLEKKEIFEKQ